MCGNCLGEDICVAWDVGRAKLGRPWSVAGPKQVKKSVRGEAVRGNGRRKRGAHANGADSQDEEGTCF